MLQPEQMFTKAALQDQNIQRECIRVEGTVQGIGFRPFVYRLARELGLAGFVQNTPAGVTIEIQGADQARLGFKRALIMADLPHLQIVKSDSALIPATQARDFTIRPSLDGIGNKGCVVPDLAACGRCLQEMRDPANRRYRYPFISCANCGPRYSVVTALPYDRSNTTMSDFHLCAACASEFHCTDDRRHHAQSIACPDCGPQLEFLDAQGKAQATRDQALQAAVQAVRDGKILALKGLGGFHLICDARNPEAVSELRRRKRRPLKPFAVMYSEIQGARSDCFVDDEEIALLSCAAAPIVLLPKQPNCTMVPEVAPDNSNLGVMLPSTPLHHLLIDDFGGPVIATSGNRANEPICIDELQAVASLSTIADCFLVHDRAIAGRCDDSVMRVVKGRGLLLRRARGFAPLPVRVRHHFDSPIMAVGGHLKNTVALAQGQSILLSPHVGDLDTPEACDAHRKATERLCSLYQVEAERLVTDLHPDYRSTQMAQQRNGDVFTVQHHYAHALACMADNGIEAPCLAVAWDGTGYGADGSIWGGEFLTIKPDGYDRMLHFMPFPLPGGDAAVKDPKRAALGLLYALDEEAAFSSQYNWISDDTDLLKAALQKGINCPKTSSVGRIFDAVAALTGVCTENGFEGQAAMALEFAADKRVTDVYAFAITAGQIDWRRMLRGILFDIERGVANSVIAAKFHNTLTATIVAAAKTSKQKVVLLTGGCFQNALLLERAIDALESEGFEVYWHRQVPPNDGGLALGQVMALASYCKASGG